MLKRSFKEQWRQIVRRSQNPRFWIILVVDIVLLLLVHLLAYLIRYETTLMVPYEQIVSLFPLLVLVKIPIFYILGLYRGMWRYTSLDDLYNIGKATACSSGSLILVVLYISHFEGFSRSVFILDGIFTFLAICLHRGTIRYVFDHIVFLKNLTSRTSSEQKTRLLLVGAGSAAEKVIREIRDNTAVNYQVVGLIDDDREKFGLKIHNIPVLGNITNLDECIERTKAEEILITIASASGEQMKRIVSVCQDSTIQFKVLPSIGEIITGDISVSGMREVDYRDLLGRPAVRLDQQEICGYLTDKTILITGAGGSIGSELCRQILSFNPDRIILLDACEENLYNIQMEFHHEHNFHNYVPVLGKIQNRRLLNDIFCKYAPSTVFHAAAYKHVPLVELNPWEAVFNNVFAVRNLIETSIYHHVDKFVLVSTDKAVRPTNVMGATKRVTELLMLAYCNGNYDKSMNYCPREAWQPSCENPDVATPEDTKHRTTFMAVRFGNVLGSSGSVIPLFKKQIEKGGPVTVTDPGMTRYFMSIDEAAQLILQAGAMGAGGEIFLLKMGKPVKIDDLAKDLIKLSGKKVDEDIEITYSGLRPGEKLYEELITEGEGIVETTHEKIMVLRGSGKPYQELEKDLESLATSSKQHDAQPIKQCLSRIVSEYTPDYSISSVIDYNSLDN